MNIVAPRLDSSDRDVSRMAALAIALLFALQVHLIFIMEINWDEFFFLSRIHDFERGTLSRALQSFHVHLFAWLPIAGGHEIGQIRLGRIAMLAFEAGTVALIYGTARAFLARGPACVAALAYCSFGYVVEHGASFRADPLAAFLMMLACFLLARSRLGIAPLALLAGAVALALLVTVKAAFYAPVLLALAIWRLSGADRPAALVLGLGVAGAGAMALFAGFYLWHESLMASADLAGSRTLLAGAFEKTIQTSELFPRADFLWRGLLYAPLQSILILAGTALAATGLARGDAPRVTQAALLSCAVPLLSFVFYRNAFPYFFAFILPPAAILAGYAAKSLGRRAVLLLCVGMAVTGMVRYALVSSGQQGQAQTIAAVHRIFPDPVFYIDRCAMLGSFPREGFFMSSWGLENYRERGQPVFREILARRAPPLLVVNSSALEAAVIGRRTDDERRLLPQDEHVLRSNYIPHWGQIWVAGKRFRPAPGDLAFEILIPGLYTLEAPTAVAIDGRLYQPNALLRLGPGIHRISAGGGATLRWGDRLAVPAEPPPTGGLFSRF